MVAVARLSAISFPLPSCPVRKTGITDKQVVEKNMKIKTCRRESRYKRRRIKRKWKVERLREKYDDYEKVFSFKNLYRAYKKCRRHVSWKSSVQKYIVNAPLHVYLTFKALMAQKFKSSGFYEFWLCERGKLRHILSVVMKERVVQRCLCDNALVPMLQRTFVHDNGACMKDKGYSFTNRRLNRHIQWHIRKHGNNGYVLIYDFRKFFDRISHVLIKGIVDKTFRDKRIVKLVYHFIDAFGNIGLGLGSQISQILALASASSLDHIIKEKLRVKCYARYNDDGYLISESKEFLKHCRKVIKETCDSLGITLNEKKTQIVKLSKFTWLKVRHLITKDNKHVKKICRRSVTKERQNLKKFRKKVDSGEMMMEDVKTSYTSWTGYAKNFNSWNTRNNMNTLFENLFGNQMQEVMV